MRKFIKYCFKWISILMMLCVCISLYGQQKDKQNKRKNNNRENQQESYFKTNISRHDYDIILCRPTNHSITLSLLVYSKIESYIDLIDPVTNTPKRIDLSLTPNEPKEIVIENLKPNKRYYYYFNIKKEGEINYSRSEKSYFCTQRDPNEPFKFTITADSHLDQNTDIQNYKVTLANALSDSADFHFELGDTFMTDKYRNNYKDAFTQYLAQRYYFGQLCNSSPLFFVLGNHDGESGSRINDSVENMTAWSNLNRKKYFPNPVPDSFYSGNNTKELFIGLPQNYYSWDWGNATFIVLDPFLYTPQTGKNDPWSRTLGIDQYNWLKMILEKSKSKFKFIFIHNLVGGLDVKGVARGGSEAAGFFEWGGKNLDGFNGFREHRPGWEKPIHELLAKYKVTAVFHGHDHLFAKQELDGIIYQCVPQPGSMGHGNIRQAEEYGYKNGTILNGPGYLKVSLDTNKVLIEFIESNQEVEHKKVVYSYNINNY
jgi:predicted phosphodiesterase